MIGQESIQLWYTKISPYNYPMVLQLDLTCALLAMLNLA